MADTKHPTKEQLLKTIEQLEKNPHDRVGILAELGITAIAAAGAGSAAAFFGATTASIPVITAVTGLGLVVAAPVGLVAGAAVAGGAVAYGIAQLIKDGSLHEGKRQRILDECRERLKDIEKKERQAALGKDDKTNFYVFLKEPLKLNLISPEDAHQLMKTVENGQISLSEAYQLVESLFSGNQPQNTEKVITSCPSCSQKLHAPSHLGKLILTCPKCKHRWQWQPK